MRFLILSLMFVSQTVFAEVQNFERFNLWAHNLIRVSDGVWDNGQKYAAFSGKSIFGQNCTMYMTSKGIQEYYISLTNDGINYIGGYIAHDSNEVNFSMNDEFIYYKRDSGLDLGAIKIQFKDNKVLSAVAWSLDIEPYTCVF